MWNHTQATGLISYIVKLLDGMTWQCHHDQLKSCLEQITHPNQPPIYDSIPKALVTAPSTSQQSSI